MKVVDRLSFGGQLWSIGGGEAAGALRGFPISQPQLRRTAFADESQSLLLEHHVGGRIESGKAE